MLPRRIKERLGAAFGAVAALLLLGGIGWMGTYAVVGTLRDAWRAGDWVGVQATVTRVDEGEVVYRYQFQGKEHYGTRAGAFVYGGTSELDDWDERMDAKLSAALKEKKPVIAFVDPDDPAQSMLDREIRWRLLLVFFPFGVLFGGLGLVIAWFLGRKALGIRASDAPPFFSIPARAALLNWAFAGLWNVFGIPLGLVALPSLYAQGEWFPFAFVAVLVGIGLLIAWSAGVKTVQALRYGLVDGSQRHQTS